MSSRSVSPQASVEEPTRSARGGWRATNLILVLAWITDLALFGTAQVTGMSTLMQQVPEDLRQGVGNPSMLQAAVVGGEVMATVLVAVVIGLLSIVVRAVDSRIGRLLIGNGTRVLKLGGASVVFAYASVGSLLLASVSHGRWTGLNWVHLLFTAIAAGISVFLYSLGSQTEIRGSRVRLLGALLGTAITASFI